MRENYSATLEFWFDLASNYSYLTAMRIEALSGAVGVAVQWRPFLLGPIFRAQGWETSPFNIYKAKARYMWRDMERLARAQGLTLVRPDPFPQNSLLAARAALSGVVAPVLPEFCRKVFVAEFALGLNISDPDVLGAIAAEIDLDAVAMLRQANSAAVKDQLRADTAEAQERGLFGAPRFVTSDGELFWGNDRLQHAIDWALGHPKGEPEGGHSSTWRAGHHAA